MGRPAAASHVDAVCCSRGPRHRWSRPGRTLPRRRRNRRVPSYGTFGLGRVHDQPVLGRALWRRRALSLASGWCGTDQDPAVRIGGQGTAPAGIAADPSRSRGLRMLLPQSGGTGRPTLAKPIVVMGRPARCLATLTRARRCSIRAGGPCRWWTLYAQPQRTLPARRSNELAGSQAARRPTG